MFPGGVPSMAPGDTRDMILSHVGYVVQGQAFLILQPWDLYRERYWYIGVNGRYLGKNYWCGTNGNIEVAVPFDFGTQIGSVYACEVGDWDGFPDVNQIPSAEQILEDEITSKRFRVRWKAKYSLSTVSGDTQLGSIAITGAVRGRNVEQVPQFPNTRGRLYYTITETDAFFTLVVRWFSGKTLVAEGTRSGSGDVTCTAMNGSGLEITATITYTGEVVHGEAYIELLWPKQYQIHYSTSALAYPRTPELTFDDKGIDDYFWLTPPELAAGAYNYNILQIDDEGNVETAPSVPDDSPKTVNAAPIAPTIVNVGIAIPKYQNSGSAKATTSATLTQAFTIVAGSNRILFVSVLVPVGTTVSGVTYNGTAVNLAHAAVTGTAYKLYLFNQLNPTVGTANIVVTCSASSDVIVAQYSQYNDLALGSLYNFEDASGANTQQLTFSEQLYTEPAIMLIFGAAYGAGAKPSGLALNVGDDTKRNEYLNTGNVLNLILGERRLFNGTPIEFNSPEVLDEMIGFVAVMSASAAGATEILWDLNGETGATYTVYSSNANEPINYGTHRPLPAPIGPSAVDATSATITLPTVTPPDVTADYATLETNILSAVQFINGHFATGETTFNANRETFITNVLSAVSVWGTAIGKALRKITDGINREYTALDTACDSVEDLALSTEAWQNFIGPYYGNFLAFLSATLDGNSGRFNMSNGVMPGGALASSTTGLGAAPDGSAGGSVLFSVTDNLKAAGEPFVKKVYTRYVVRASKGGIEERNDIEFVLESDGAGAAIAARPNNSFINAIRFEGGSMFVTVGVLEENAAALASSVEISVVSAGASESFGTETDLPEAEGNYHEVEVEFVMPGNGFFDVATRALSTNGGTSANYQTQRVYYSSALPASATNKAAAVVRGEPSRAPEGDA